MIALSVVEGRKVRALQGKVPRNTWARKGRKVPQKKDRPELVEGQG